MKKKIQAYLKFKEIIGFQYFETRPFSRIKMLFLFPLYIQDALTMHYCEIHALKQIDL